MTLETLDGHKFAQMVLLGATHLANHAKIIDALNVFPVPDGDTGTNMNLSISTGAKEVRSIHSNNVAEVANAFAKGLLMGARGNSGVILSQLFRGFAIGFENKEKVTAKDFAQALQEGVNTAYKAVMKPVEGTILTVAKDSAKLAVKLVDQEKDIIRLMERVLQEAKESLERTPDLLPVLKEVGVVDSGGQGLVIIYEGFLHALTGEELVIEDEVDIEEMVNIEHQKIAQDFMSADDIQFGYCTEFIVKFEDTKTTKYPFNEAEFRSELNHYGDSLLVVSDPEVVKVHIHTEEPGEVLNLGQQFGSFLNIDIENMRQQHANIVGTSQADEANNERTPYAVITVALGSGIKSLLESLGASIVIEGGQTMNPSTQEITNAIAQANADNIIILPNNKNIVMAAEQAAAIANEQVSVIPTTSIPQGISALLSFNEAESIEINEQKMTDAMDHVKTGQVTYAVRDTTFNGVLIEKGNYMAIADGQIKSTHQNRLHTVQDFLQKFIQSDDEILTILYGEDVSSEEVNELQQYIEQKYDDLEIEAYHGNQPIYSYIFSLE